VAPMSRANPHLDARRGARLFGGERRPYQTCARCVMDTSDPEIHFDAEGVCNHCRVYEQVVSTSVFRGEDGRRRLDEAVRRIVADGAGKPYDCIIGLSGGVDSTYTAFLVKQLGLRPLAVHLDNGWNSEIAVRNIENIVNRLGFDLYTKVLDWEEFRRLQLAFLRASTPDSEIPTDHAIVATLYLIARERGIRWIVDGGNIVTEMMIPPTWSHGHADWKYIRSVHKRFDGAPLRMFPRYTIFDSVIRLPKVDRIQRLGVLNYVDYDKPAAMETLKRELSWEYYGGKHYESFYTRVYQGYILKEKFGFDKRRPHLSCLVNDGKISRADALRELEKPAIEPAQLREDRAFVVKKLRITEAEFDAIMRAERRTFWDYPSYERDLAAGARWSSAYAVTRLNTAIDVSRGVLHLAVAAARAPRKALRRLVGSCVQFIAK
jgi:N-acetyl sugar amidotransferase